MYPTKFAKEINAIDFNCKNYYEVLPDAKRGLLKMNFNKLACDLQIDKFKHAINHRGSDVVTHISFNQDKIIEAVVNHSQKYMTLKGYVRKFDGLCDLICNRILLNDLLGQKAHGFHVAEDDLDTKTIKASHLTQVYSSIEVFIAFAFGIYADNLLTRAEQKELVQKSDKTIKVNPDALGAGLKKLKVGEYAKVEVVWKRGLSFTGHSLLVKKIANDRYNFFDPNSGEKWDLNDTEVASRIQEVCDHFAATDLFLISGNVFKKRVQERKIWQVFRHILLESYSTH